MLERTAATREIEGLLAEGMPRTFARDLRAVLAHDLFRRQEGVTAAQAGELAYRRARLVADKVGLGREDVRGDPRKLYALHEGLGPVDGVACTVLSIHYCLGLGSLLALGEERPELEPFVAELESMASVGLFLATELGYGNNVVALETRAVYDPESREFSIETPNPRAGKFMPNTACAVPKLAVVMARLVSQGEDHGVFPFVVRIRDELGRPCPGVRITPLPEKPGYPLDNAITSFDGVRIPKHQLLCGAESVLHDDGRFESRIRSPRSRFLQAVDRVQTGRVCFAGAVVAALRAATWIAMRYAKQRLTFAPLHENVSLIHYRNVQRDLFDALATSYALTFGVRHVQRRFGERSPENEDETFRLVAAIKAVASYEAADALGRLRERCGAAGMFSANRILDYWNQVQGVITAEGDNQIMMLKVGRQLLPGPEDDAVAAPHPVEQIGEDPAHLATLLHFREVRLRDEVRQGLDEALSGGAEPFEAWNDNVNAVLALARAYGLAVIADCFRAVLERCRDARAAQQLRSLFCLWCLRHIEAHAGWFLAEGALTGAQVKELARRRDRLCAGLEPDAMELADAFGLDNELLQAPIAEEDYVAAYDAHARSV